MSTRLKENRKPVTAGTSLPDTRKESEIEKKFRIACRRYGGIAKKQTAGGGDLDRRVIWNGGVTTYAELKRPTGGVTSDLQAEELKLLQSMGHVAMVVANELDIAMFIKLSLERVMKA